MQRKNESASLLKIIETPLSSFTIEKVFNGRANIVMLSDVNNMSSLDHLFGKFNHVILFISIDAPNNGHWISLLKNGDTIIYMDSLGFKPLEILDMMKARGLPVFGQTHNLLKIIKASNYKFVYNTHQYQHNNDSVQTCGRYAILFVALNQIFILHNRKISPQIIYKIMTHWLKTSKLKDYDALVSELSANFTKK